MRSETNERTCFIMVAPCVGFKKPFLPMRAPVQLLSHGTTHMYNSVASPFHNPAKMSIWSRFIMGLATRAIVRVTTPLVCESLCFGR
jgi:hypothetical protein